LNKRDLIEKMAADVGFSKKTAGCVIDTVLRKITKRLKKGKTLTIVGFGTFHVSARKKRKGRNPRTGEVLKIPAVMVPKFSAGSKLRRAVNQGEQAMMPANDRGPS
jgi:DNA-binding protein HU-beta